MVEPGTSALFIVARKVTADKTMEAGQVRRHRPEASLSKEAEEQLQQALQGSGGASQASEPATAGASSS